MQKNGFVIEGSVLKAYIGNPEITELVIPEGVVTIQDKIFQDQVGNSMTVVFPSTIKNIKNNAFTNGNIFRLDFRNCNKLQDFSTVIERLDPKKPGYCLADSMYINELVLPTSIVSFSLPDELKLEFGKVKFADENGIVELSDLSKCKNLKKISFKNVNCSAQTMTIPDSLISFEQGALNCQELKISSNSRLEELHVHDLNIVTVPSKVRKFESKNVKYVFFAKSALDTVECKCDAYVIENVDIENITFKDEMKDKGLKYFETSKGLVITDLDNRIAKFTSLPTEFEGKKIVAFCNINPFEKYDTYNDEKLSTIKSEMKYKLKENFDATKKLATKLSIWNTSTDDRDYTANNFTKKEIWKISLLCGLIGFVLFSIIAVAIFGGRLGNFKEDMMENIVLVLASVVPFILGGGFVFAIIIAIVASCIVSIRLNFNPKFRPKLRKHLIESSIYKNVEEPYRWKALNYFKCKRNQDYKEDRERSMAKAREEKWWDEYRNGTKEEQQRKAIANKLDELNSNLRNSSNSGSYDMYDDRGNYVGRIDKKD